MTGREKFLRIARGELKGEVFLPFNLNYSWFMEETLQRWEKEGLPEKVNIRDFFGFERIELIGGNPYGLVPPFEEKVISETQEIKIIRDEIGITKRVFKEHSNSKMPQWIDFPIKNRKDFQEFKKRLNPFSPSRYSFNLKDFKKDRDYPLGIATGSFYGHTLQRWVGTENLCILFYDDPSFIYEMLDYLEYFFLEIIKQFIKEINFDFASFGEDIAYKERSFISPEMFKKFIQPHYVKICKFLKANGIEVIFVDSDGYIEELIPLWIEVGINGFSPLEVAAGMDAVSLKKKYGNNIVLVGNVDKRSLIRGKNEIDKEIEKIKILISQGGYFPAVDHSIPPDVPYENFKYFLNAIKKLQSS